MSDAGKKEKLEGILPWTRRCFVCGQDNPHGLRLKSHLKDGAVFLEYTTRESDLGWRMIVHGGIAMTLLDEVMTWAAIVEAGQACVSVEITTRMKKPVRVSQKIRAEGRIKEARSRLFLTEAVLTGDGGEILAVASGKYLPMPASEYKLCAEDFVSSPEAIPPGRILLK